MGYFSRTVIASLAFLGFGFVGSPRAGAQLSLVGTSQYPGLTVGADGWTVFTPASDTRTVYVSSSGGNDANSGLSAGAPKQTLAAASALMRDGYPDWMLLKAGDTWLETFPFWAKSGRSVTAPMLIGSYGAGERPLLKTGQATAFATAAYVSTARQHLVLTDLHFWAHTNDGTGGAMGVDITNGLNDVLIENCFVEQYPVNIGMQGIETRPTNMKIRRCVITNSLSTTGYSTGMIFGHADNILIEECVFDHNGWSEVYPNCAPTIFSHNCYINPDNTTGVSVRGCVVARGAASGIRSSGSLCENNLVLQNPIGLVVGPDTRVLRNNVILDSRNIGADPRGLGIDGTIGGDVEIYGNILAHQTSGTGNTKGMNLSGAYGGLRIHDNIVYNWVQSVNAFAPAVVLDGAPLKAVRVYNNQFQQAGGAIYQQSAPVIAAMYSYSGNRYYASGNSQPFLENPSWLTYAQWLGFSGETGSAWGALTYPDANRTIATYMTTQGGAPTLDAFMTQARRQARGNWRAAYTAGAVAAYVRAGFGVQGGPACSADLNGDGALTVADINMFLNFFAARDPRANCDASTTVPVLNMLDFTCFLNAFATGCP